jgi:hypothetical protein
LIFLFSVTAPDRNAEIVVPANAGTIATGVHFAQAVGHRALSTNHAVWVPAQGRDDQKNGLLSRFHCRCWNSEPMLQSWRTRPAEGPNLDSLVPVVLGLMIGAAPAVAAVEQCRFIQAKPEREACYQRQAIALAAKRKPEPEPTADTRTLETLQQMRRDDDEVYKSLRSICRGC